MQKIMTVKQSCIKDINVHNSRRASSASSNLTKIYECRSIITTNETKNSDVCNILNTRKYGKTTSAAKIVQKITNYVYYVQFKQSAVRWRVLQPWSECPGMAPAAARRSRATFSARAVCRTFAPPFCGCPFGHTNPKL